MAIFTPYISAYYVQQGMNESQIGVLSAVIPLASLLIQPIWAYISDKTGKRKGMLLFLKADGFKGFLAAVFLYAAFYSALLPLSDALVLKEAERKETDFAMIRMSGTLCYALAVFVTGYYLKSKFQLMFVLDSVCYVIFFLCCMTLKDGQTERAASEETGVPKAGHMSDQNKEKTRKKLFQSKQIVVIFICAFAMQLGIYYHSTFLGVYLLELKYSQTMIGLMSCIAALSEVPVLLAINKLYRKYSAELLLLITVLLCAARLLLVSTGSIALMLAAQFLQGPSFMICYFTCVMYINEQVRRDRISQGQSMLALVQNGLGAICGTLLGGYITQELGIQKGFCVMAGTILFIAAGAVLIGRWIRCVENQGNNNEYKI